MDEVYTDYACRPEHKHIHCLPPIFELYLNIVSLAIPDVLSSCSLLISFVDTCTIHVCIYSSDRLVLGCKKKKVMGTAVLPSLSEPYEACLHHQLNVSLQRHVPLPTNMHIPMYAQVHGFLWVPLSPPLWPTQRPPLSSPPLYRPIQCILTPFCLLTLLHIDCYTPPSLLTATNVVLALMLLTPLAHCTAMLSSSSSVTSMHHAQQSSRLSYIDPLHTLHSGKHLAQACPWYTQMCSLGLSYQTLACYHPCLQEQI